MFEREKKKESKKERKKEVCECHGEKELVRDRVESVFERKWEREKKCVCVCAWESEWERERVLLV